MALRKRAEEIARETAEPSPENISSQSPEEIQQTIHELRVHQIELEIQNEEMRRTQAELKASRARYFDLYDLAPIAYVTVSEKGIILEANLTAAILLGVARGKLVRQLLTIFILKEDQDIYYRHRKQLFQTGEPQACELRMLNKDGKAFWAHLAATAAQNAQGEPVCSVLLIDITERKRLEEEGLQGESRLRKLVDILQHPAETIQDFLDYALEQVIGLTESKIGYIYHYHEDRREFVLNTWSKEVMPECTVANQQTCYELDKTGIWGEAIRQRKPIIINDFPAGHPLKKGYPAGHVQLLKFLTVPIFKGGSIVGVVGLANKETDYKEADILQVSLLMEAVWKVTERMRAEDALRESEFRLARAEKVAKIGNWKLMLDTKEFIGSIGAKSIYGMEADIISLDAARKFALPEYIDILNKALTDLITKDIPYSLDIKICRPTDGKIIDIHSIAEYDKENKIVYGVIQDITDIKQAEEEKRTLTDRLIRSEKMESLGTLAGGVAHDLNNVLGIVVGYAELALGGMDKSSPLRRHLENVMSGGLKAASIVDDLLTLARRGVSTRDIINLNKIIDDCQKSPELENLCSRHPSIKFKMDIDADLLNIFGSSMHLGKSLYNLISNAAESMPKGGSVTIKTTNQYLDKPISGYDKIQAGDYVTLSVSDTGEGIPESDRKRIFEPFYTKKVMGRSGTGLGLAVVWGTVKDHDGYINVETEVGKGTIFTLYFPVTRNALSPEAEAVAISAYMGKGESILVIDDVKEQRDLAAGMLRTLNYNVSSVSSGEEAIAYLKEHQADLLVLDMIMDPGMDGLDTYKSILKIHPQQKAIIVSGFSESDRVKDAKGLGAGVYLRKPYIKEKLGLAVRSELDRSR